MHKGCCIHFNGIQNEACKAGHSYQEMARPKNQDEMTESNAPRWAFAYRIPCWQENGVSGCPGYQLPTDEQVVEHNARHDEYIKVFLERLAIVRPAIEGDIQKREAEDASIIGDISCPVCKQGTVHYAYAGGYNKHIGAKCTTEDCVQWQE